MANWLEEEEHRQSLLLQREEMVRTHLRALYDLCDRVNGVTPGSLRMIGWFIIEGLRTYWIIPERVRGKRRLRLNCQSDSVTFIDAIIDEEDIHRFMQDGTSLNREFVVLRTACSLHDLSEWREDQILNAIQWMMLESEAIKGNIPGTEVTTTDVADKGLLTGVDFTYSPAQLPSHGRVILRGTQFMTEHAAVLFERQARRTSEESARRQAEHARREARNKGSCFVATAAYGAPDMKLVCLQAYRDRILNTSIVGRIAVRVYYLVSPSLARFIEVSERRRSVARGVLGPLAIFARWRLEHVQERDT